MRHKRQKKRDEARGTRDVVHHPSFFVLHQCRGFTIVELLFALAITGMLLAAVAVAFNASVINYRENEEIFKTINNARQALLRMTSQLRTACPVDPNAPSNECSLFTAEGQDITYEYRSSDNKLYLITNIDDREYVLCDNVISMSFIKTATDEGSDCKSVQISMTVQNGDMQRTLSAAVVIRKNLI
jgi:prepilin-type N-terminal cleavage/methylation domain-containing protein